jgi:beta-glucosidase
MRISAILALFFLLIVLPACTEQASYRYPFQNPHLSIGKRVNDLISRMTVTEKIKQLDMYHGYEVAHMQGHNANTYSAQKTAQALDSTGVGSVHDFYPLRPSIANEIQRYAITHTRLGIPVLFIEEGLHGYNGLHATYFPVPLELSSTWDTSLIRSVGHVIASEARAHGVDMVLSPVLGLARDPRWGRTEETYGEDPYLNGAAAVAMVRGLQGDTLAASDAVIAEPKHFAMHSIPEAGSNTSPVSIGEREAHSSFLYVFKKAVQQGGAKGIMAAYSELDGIPCIDNKWLLTDVLRKQWGFRGFVLSDLGAIRMTLEDHHVAVDTADALAQAIKAGVNMQFYDFRHTSFQDAIKYDLKVGALTSDDLNRAVADVLRVKFMLGLFDHPYTDTTLANQVYQTDAGKGLALKAAQEGIILLKNEKNVLPVNSAVRQLAVIGPLAKSTYLGDYSAGATGISILKGLSERAGDSLQITYAAGYGKDGQDSARLLAKAVETSRRADMAVVVLGEDESVDGEGKDRADLKLDDRQRKLIQAIYQTGKPVAVVLFNGRPLTINWVADHVPAIVEAWYPGEEGGLAIADVLLGRVNPSAKLPITFPRSVGQLPFYYDHKPTSWHRYVDQVNTPLFPFGQGLSYTTFVYSDLDIMPGKIASSDTANVNLRLKNTGNRAGTEVVQLYIRDIYSSVTTPVKALKGFKRVRLQPGESAQVNFKIPPEDLSLWNRAMKQVVEPGEFTVMVGTSSADIRLKGSLWVTADKKSE